MTLESLNLYAALPEIVLLLLLGTVLLIELFVNDAERIVQWTAVGELLAIGAAEADGVIRPRVVLAG